MARMASIFFGSCSPAPVAGSVVDFSWVKWPQNPPHPYWSSPRTLASLFLSTPTGHIPESRYRRQMIFGQREVLAEKRADGCELPVRSALRCPQDAQACSALFLPPSNVNSFLSCLPVCLTICWFPQFWLCFPGSLFTKESFFK